MASIMWRSGRLGGLDRCVLDTTPDGHRLSGTSLLVVEGSSCEIRYSILVDRDWRTKTVGADVQSDGPRRSMALTADGDGNWWMGDAPLLDFYGAIDIDLAWTPATNTIPIRRLGLEVGESADIIAALVAFPEHEITRATQRYTRTAPGVYRYEAGDFTADLTVDQHGLVTDYPDAWTAVI